MRGIVGLILCCGVAAQISAPRIGFSRFPDGTVRPVEGLPGAFIAGEPVLRGALSFGFSGVIGIAKLPNSIAVLDGGGVPLFEVRAEAGPAVIGFSADGHEAVVAAPGWAMLCDAAACRQVIAPAPDRLRAAAIDARGLLFFATDRELLTFRADRRRALRREPLDVAPALLRSDGSVVGMGSAEWIGKDWASVRSGDQQSAWNVRTGAVSPLNSDAGFTLSLWRDGTTSPITGTVELGSFALGESHEFRIQIDNPGNGPIVLDYLPTPVQSPSKAFRYNEPSVPYTIAPGKFVDVLLWFEPAAAGDYTIVVKINGSTVTLKATALPVPVWTAGLDGTPGTLTPGSTIDFGRIQKGSSATRRIVLTNSSIGPATVKSISAPGAPFRTGAVTLPLVVEVGAMVPLDVIFEPSSSGTFTTTLAIDSLSMKLAGFAFDPPLPKPAVDVGTAVWTSVSQRTVSVKFADAAQTGGSGTLKLEFKPAAGAATDDDAVRFTNGGARMQSFQFAKGDAQATFGTTREIAVQTGTTAGTLVFTATVGTYAEQFSYRIDPAKVALDSVIAERSTGSITVTATGYDNSRTAGSLSFTFYDTSGRSVGAALAADLVSDFKKFFAASPSAGGAFVIRAVFPVSGDISQIASVDVRMANAIDSVTVERVAIK